MVVLIRNLQKRTILNIPAILQNSNTLVEILRISQFDVNLVFVGKGFIKSLNLRYRRRNVATDVLAFPYLKVSFVENRKNNAYIFLQNYRNQGHMFAYHIDSRLDGMLVHHKVTPAFIHLGRERDKLKQSFLSKETTGRISV